MRIPSPGAKPSIPENWEWSTGGRIIGLLTGWDGKTAKAIMDEVLAKLAPIFE
jgi:hypothetical protein